MLSPNRGPVGQWLLRVSLFVPVLNHRLVPSEVLSSSEAPELLSRIAGACVEHTHFVIAQSQG